MTRDFASMEQSGIHCLFNMLKATCQSVHWQVCILIFRCPFFTSYTDQKMKCKIIFHKNEDDFTKLHWIIIPSDNKLPLPVNYSILPDLNKNFCISFSEVKIEDCVLFTVKFRVKWWGIFWKGGGLTNPAERKAWNIWCLSERDKDFWNSSVQFNFI